MTERRPSSSTTPRTPSGTLPALERTLFILGLAANLVVALSGLQFPYEDSTNHLARYVMLDRAWLGAPGAIPPYLSVHFVIGPYLGFDLIGVALVHAIGPAHALRVIAALTVCAVPIGLWMLLRAVGGDGDNRAWALVGVLLSMGFFTVVGFVNYVVGVGCALAWLAAWWPRRASPSWRRVALLSLGVAILYLLHLSAPIVALVVVGVDSGTSLLAAVGGDSPGTALGRCLDRLKHDRRLQAAIVYTVVLGAMAMLATLGPALPPHGAGTTEFHDKTTKLRNTLSVFYVFSFGQALVMLGVYLMMVAGFVWTNRDTLSSPGRWGVFGVSAAIMLALYFAFPAGTPGTGYLDMRWLLPAFLLPFAAAGTAGRPPPRAVLWTLFGGCILHVAVLWRSTRAIDRELADYASALRGLPPAARVLPIVADNLRHGARVFPYRHYAFWYVIERDGRVPTLFNGAGAGGGRPNLAFLRHFVERDHLYDPGDMWGTREFAPLDWARISHDYDYVIQAGRDPRVSREIDKHARETQRIGDVTVFGPLHADGH